MLNGTLETLKAQHRSTGLTIEFASKEDRKRFIEMPEIQALQPVSNNGYGVQIGADNVEATSKQVLKLLVDDDLVPVRFEINEPTIESLFLEVVR